MRSLPHRISHGDKSSALSGEQTKDVIAWREALELERTYYTIKKPVVRRRIAELVKSIATTLADE